MKKRLLLFECFFLVLTIITIKKTYGLFETESNEIDLPKLKAKEKKFLEYTVRLDLNKIQEDIENKVK